MASLNTPIVPVRSITHSLTPSPYSPTGFAANNAPILPCERQPFTLNNDTNACTLTPYCTAPALLQETPRNGGGHIDRRDAGVDTQSLPDVAQVTQRPTAVQGFLRSGRHRASRTDKAAVHKPPPHQAVPPVARSGRDVPLARRVASSTWAMPAWAVVCETIGRGRPMRVLVEPGLQLDHLGLHVLNH